MKQKQIEIQKHDSSIGEFGNLIISIQNMFSGEVDIVVGRPGMLNVETRLKIGGALLFETPDEGIFEVRLVTKSMISATLLVSHVSPHPGLTGGFIDESPYNHPFTPEEVSRIEKSLQEVKQVLSKRDDITPEQQEIISQKLDEMKSASERMGRKDWKNLAVGTLTSIVVATALDTDARKALFISTGEALSWLFEGVLKLLS